MKERNTQATSSVRGGDELLDIGLVENPGFDPSKEVTKENRPYVAAGEEYFLKGHFPGAPIFPGAMMQELATQSAGILIAARHNPMEIYNTHDPHFNKYALGVLVRVKQARYKGFARPGDRLRVEVKLNEMIGGIFDFSARITVDNKLITKNQFQLTNVLSSILSGKES